MQRVARGKGKAVGWESHCVKKTRTVDETEGPWADQQALYHTNIKPPPSCLDCTVAKHTHANRHTPFTVWVFFIHWPLSVMCREDVIIYEPVPCWMKAKWIAAPEAGVSHPLFPSSGRCVWHQSAEYTSGHENNIQHIAWKTISLCTGWSTLYHSNSGQGNREMMREKRN